MILYLDHYHFSSPKILIVYAKLISLYLILELENCYLSFNTSRIKFGLHSLRSGGVSEAAHNRIPQRLIKAHGRWKSDIAKDGYIKENMRNRLSVSKNLNI